MSSTIKRNVHQGDCPGRDWRRWRQTSTSPVTNRAVNLTTLFLRFKSIWHMPSASLFINPFSWFSVFQYSDGFEVTSDVKSAFDTNGYVLIRLVMLSDTFRLHQKLSPWLAYLLKLLVKAVELTTNDTPSDFSEISLRVNYMISYGPCITWSIFSQRSILLTWFNF